MKLFSPRSLVLLALGLCSVAAAAPPRAVETFDAAGWAALRDDPRRPAIVVFTATDCAHCPAVIEALSRDPRLRRSGGRLVAVVMDVAPGESDAVLLRSPHYRRADRLLAFSGQAPALRHAVNPAWRGVTPYLALLRPGEAPAWVTGPPAPGDLDTWARPAAAPASHLLPKARP